jgi:hypothetical protein
MAGFNLSRVVTPESLEDFVDRVVPILQERGAYKGDYRPGTLCEKLVRPVAAAAAQPPGWRAPPARYGDGGVTALAQCAEASPATGNAGRTRSPSAEQALRFLGSAGLKVRLQQRVRDCRSARPRITAWT